MELSETFTDGGIVTRITQARKMVKQATQPNNRARGRNVQVRRLAARRVSPSMPAASLTFKPIFLGIAVAVFCTTEFIDRCRSKSFF
jgi:hypothetical protein